MTESEKAKAYDEALKKAKNVQETSGSNVLVDWMEYIFPELAESKDEKIRKALVDALNKNLGNGIEKYGTTLNAALAWLEKQGEQKTEKKELKKSQRMISAEAKEALYDKPATWSEEDEVRLSRIVENLELLNVADGDILLKDIDWLKSLKTE